MNGMPSDPAGRPDPANDTTTQADAARDPLAAAAERIAALEADVAGLKDQYLRAVAETDNVRRRGDRERQDALKYGASSFAKDMLSVADNLRRALDALPDEVRSDEKTRGFVDGVELTERELLAAMGRHGIERVAPLDVPFDHDRHQAMFEVPGTGKPAGTVVQCLQPGYVMHGRLLRPALVGVAKDSPAARPPAPVSEDEPTLG